MTIMNSTNDSVDVLALSFKRLPFTFIGILAQGTNTTHQSTPHWEIALIVCTTASPHHALFWQYPASGAPTRPIPTGCANVCFSRMARALPTGTA